MHDSMQLCSPPVTTHGRTSSTGSAVFGRITHSIPGFVRRTEIVQPTAHRWVQKILVPFVVAGLCVGCGDVSSPEGRLSDFSGIIVEVADQPISNHQSAVHVKRTAGDTAVVRAMRRTRIYARLAGSRLRSIGWRNLAIGDSVEVWHTGAEYRSLPPQYDGIQLVIW
jgi:hypothetical protein